MKNKLFNKFLILASIGESSFIMKLILKIIKKKEKQNLAKRIIKNLMTKKVKEIIIKKKI